MTTEDKSRPTKAERKEQARIEREEIQRKQASRSRNRKISVIAAVALGAVVIGLLLVVNRGGGETASSTPPGVVLPDPATLPGIMQTPPPWSNNLDQANQRLAQLALPPLGTTLHHHVRLFIYVDGQPVVVPAEVGYNEAKQVFAPLHTHDESGTMHVESTDTSFQPVLGQFMDVWGLYFTPDCIGNQCGSGDRQIRVFVNGQPYTGDPTLVPLLDQSAVVITMGTEAELPNPIPDSFTFEPPK
jgi:hypothetical protein